MSRPAYASEAAYGNTGTCTPAYPAGLAAGDLLVAFASTGGSSASSEGAAITPPTDHAWTTVDNSGPSLIAYRVADGTESGTSSWTHGTITGVLVVNIVRVTGASTSSPVVSTTKADTSTGSASSITGPSQSVPSDSMLLLHILNAHTTSAITYTPPSGATTQTSGTTGGLSPRRMAVGTTPEDHSNATTTGTQVWGVSASTEMRLACILIQPSGAISAGVSESAGATDSVGAILTTARPTAETAAASDSTSRTRSGSRSTSETATASDSVARTSSQPRATAETATGSDTVARTLATNRAVAETASGSDTASRTGTYTRAAADTAAAVDLVDGVESLLRSAAETAAAVDTVSTGQPVHATAVVSEAAAATDTTGTIASYTRTVLEVATSLDTVVLGALWARGVAEAAQALDTVTAHMRVPHVRFLRFTERNQTAVAFTEQQRQVTYAGGQRSVTFEEQT